MDIVIASHSKPRWSCHHCICPEKQLLHQKDWLHRDSGHFLWDFLRFFVWEIASSPAPNLFSITFSEKQKIHENLRPEGGPMKVMPFSLSFCGSLGFSLA